MEGSDRELITGMQMLPRPTFGFLAGILESEHHREADPSLPVGGGVRTVVTDQPWTFSCHIAPHERFFLVPRIRVPMPIPWGWNPWIVGSAEIHVATMIWPEPLKRWGVWEAKKYFEKRVLPQLVYAHNRPDWWWQRPSDWAI